MIPVLNRSSDRGRKAVTSGGGGGGGGYSAEVLADSPIGYWRQNEPAGTTGASCPDSSGNARHGSHLYDFGSVTGAIVGDSDAATLHTLGYSYVEVPYSSAFDLTTQVTLEAWVYPTTAAYMGIIDKTLGGNTNQCYQLFLTSSNDITFRTNTAAAIDLTAVGAVTQNAWNHIACVYNAGAKRILVNGLVVASSSVGSTINATGNGALLIGSLGNGLWQFVGRLDEVALYGTALSNGRILAHYNEGT